MKKSIHNRHILYSNNENRIAQNYTNDPNIDTYDFDLEESDFDFFLDLPVYRKMRKFKNKTIMEVDIRKAWITILVLIVSFLGVRFFTDSYWIITGVLLFVLYITSAIYDYFN